MPQFKYIHTQEIANRIPVLCGLLFAAYSFVFLYRSQCYVQALQQRLSNADNSSFSPIFTAVFITLLSVSLGALLQRLMRWLPLRLLALPWFVPLLSIAILSHWHYPQFGDIESPCGWMIYVFFLLIYVALLIFSFLSKDTPSENNSFSAYAWPNLLLMLLFIMMSTRISNTNTRLSQTLRVNRCLSQRDYQSVIDVCERSTSLTQPQSAMLAWALYNKGQLGERLFHFPNTYGSEGLLPLPSDTILQTDLSQLQGHYFGYTRGRHLRAIGFLETIHSMPKAKPAVVDYLLCAYLLDAQLDKFATLLASNNDNLCDTLPRHYREALVLYQHTRSNPVTHLEDNAMESNFRDFKNLRNSFTEPHDRKYNCREMYGDTYWYYYYNVKEGRR